MLPSPVTQRPVGSSIRMGGSPRRRRDPNSPKARVTIQEDDASNTASRVNKKDGDAALTTSMIFSRRSDGNRSSPRREADNCSITSGASRVSRRSTVHFLPPAERKEILMGGEFGDIFEPVPWSAFLMGEPDEWREYDALFKRLDVKDKDSMIRAQTKVFLALERNRANLGINDLRSVDCEYDLCLLLKAAENVRDAQTGFRHVIAQYDAQLGPEHEKTVNAATQMAILDLRRGNLEESLLKFKKVLSVREATNKDDPRCLAILNQMANIEKELRLSDEAEMHYQRVINGWKDIDAYHIESLNAMNNLGILQHVRNHSKRAMISHKNAYDGLAMSVGPAHPLSQKVLYYLGIASIGAERLEDANVYLECCYELRKRTFGDHHLETLDAALEYGQSMKKSKKLDEAEKYFQIAYAGRSEVLGEKDRMTLAALEELAILSQSTDLNKAESYYIQCITAHTEISSEFSVDALRCGHELGVVYMNNGKKDCAVQQLQKTLNGKTRVYSPDHYEFLATKNVLDKLAPNIRKSITNAVEKKCCTIM